MLTLATASLIMFSGCEVLITLLQFQSQTTTVRLVNNTAFAVQVDLYYHDEQLIPEVLLTEIGTNRTYTLAAGESASFSEQCEELQAIIIDDADLTIIGNVGPEADTDVLRDGDDFNCGDRITFTFEGGVLDFSIDVDIGQ